MDTVRIICSLLPFRVFERKLLTFTGNTSVIVLRVFLNLGNLNSLWAQSLLLEDQRGETSSEGQKLIFSHLPTRDEDQIRFGACLKNIKRHNVEALKVKCIKKLLIFLNDNLLLVPRSLKCRKMFTAFQQKKTYKYCKCPKNKCKIIMVACWSWFPSLRTDKLGIVSHKKNKRRHLINEIFPKHLKPWKVVEWRGKN